MAMLPLRLVGAAPYLQCRFPEKARNSIMEKQAAGSQAGTKRKRTARDFDADYQQSMHFLADGSNGMPAAAFRAAAISACRIVGFKMTLAKLSIFIEPDGFDPARRDAAGQDQRRRRRNTSCPAATTTAAWTSASAPSGTTGRRSCV
jgi:hypothetical protein